MNFGNKQTWLAPLAGVTDTVFRTLCKQNGADIVVSEMVSAEGIFHNARNTKELLQFNEAERPIGIQLFGADAAHMAYAAAYVEEHVHPDFIDLNCGCPVPKVVKKNGGSALLRTPELFKDIVTRMVKSVSIPVTVKIRSGWDMTELTDVTYAKIAEDCGAAAVILHPRTKTMMFGGHSMWERITEVKQSVSIPVIGNGDIHTPQDAEAMFCQTGCDGVMVGRAAMGNPWIFSRIRQLCSNLPIEPVSLAERGETALTHIHLFTAMYGSGNIICELKKHIAWYCKGLPLSGSLRNDIFHAETIEHIETLVRMAFEINNNV
jgi:nifR3 family TIM-barrel protein